MGGFRFKYQKLLEIKEKHEEVARGKLNEAQIKLKEQEAQFEKLQKYKNNIEGDLSSRIEKGIDVGFLQKNTLFLQRLKSDVKTQKKVIEKCSQEVSDSRIELIKASKETKTFEKLKEKEIEEFHYNEKKEEESFVDQLVTFKNYKCK